MIIAAARSGASTAYITRVGDDEFGRMFLDLWRREGVDTRWVIVDRDAPTAAYFVTHGPQGHAFSYLRKHSAASRLQRADIPDLSAAAVVHASGISMAISQSACDAVFAAFESTEGKIAFDSNLRLKLWPLERASEMIGRAAGMADYFFSEHRGRTPAEWRSVGGREPQLGARPRRENRVPEARSRGRHR